MTTTTDDAALRDWTRDRADFLEKMLVRLIDGISGVHNAQGCSSGKDKSYRIVFTWHDPKTNESLECDLLFMPKGPFGATGQNSSELQASSRRPDAYFPKTVLRELMDRLELQSCRSIPSQGIDAWYYLHVTARQIVEAVEHLN